MKLPKFIRSFQPQNSLDQTKTNFVVPDSSIPKNEIKSAPKEEENLTAKLNKQSWYREFETIKRWRTALQYAENPVQRQRLLLYRIYEEVWLDTNVRSLIELKKDRIKSVNFNLISDVDSKPLVEETKIFEAEWFSRLLDSWVDSQFWGYTLNQIVAINDRGHMDLVEIDRKYIIPERKEYKDNVYSIYGKSYNEEYFLDWLIEIGKNTDLGLFSSLAPICLWKRNCLQNWSQFQERFGIPIIDLQTTSKKPEEWGILEEFAKNLGSSGYLLHSDQEILKFVETNNTDAYHVFDEMIKLCDKEIAKIILGADINDNGGGSYAQAKVKDRQGDIKTMSDLRTLEFWINEYLIPKMKKLEINIPDNCYFKFDKNSELSLDAQMKIDEVLLKYFKIDPSYFEDKYNLPIEGEREIKNNFEQKNTPVE